MKKRTILSLILALTVSLAALALAACGGGSSVAAPTPETSTSGKSEFTGITLSDSSVTYDGEEHGLTVSGTLPAGTNVAYTYNDSAVAPINAGEYSVKATLTNPNYNSKTLTATLTIKTVPQIASEIIGALIKRPDPWAFLPEAFGEESMAFESSPAMDFAADFVSVSQIQTKFIGKQMHVLYEGLGYASKAINAAETVFNAGTMIAEAYQTYLDGSSDNHAEFSGSAAGLSLKITLVGNTYTLLAGNSTVSVELEYNGDKGERVGRIQITDGIALKYVATQDTLSLGIKATIGGVGNLKQIVFARNGNAVTGHFYEFTGSEGTNLKTSATIAVDEQHTTIVSDKRESDDLKINGSEEVYDNATGKFLAGEVAENVSNDDYDTLWFNLGDVTGITSIKVIHEQNGLFNPDTIYINGYAGHAIETKHVVALKKGGSRYFDIEMKEVWYVVKSTDGGKVSYDTVKTTIPMLFVQKEYYGTFGGDFYDKNKDKNVTAPPSINAARYTAATARFTALVALYEELKAKVGFADIVAFIGEKNPFFSAS